MALITIREQSAPANGSNGSSPIPAVVSIDHGPEYSVTMSAPFDAEQEGELEWYFEEHLHLPFLEGKRAEQAAASIQVYGEHLFKQLFADQDLYAEYKQCSQNGPDTLQLEIVGSPSFHRLHWEALRDPRWPQPLALHTPVIRKNTIPAPTRAQVRPSPTINVLIVVARPFGNRDVGYRTISRPLVEALRQSQVPVQIDILRPGTYKALDQHLRESTNRYGNGYYHVIHFDVHGAVLAYDAIEKGQQANHYLYGNPYGRKPIQQYEGRRAFLFLEDEQQNKADPVEAQALADLLIYHQIPIAILNACQSGKETGSSESSLGNRLMQAGVQLVLGMGYSVTVSAAALMMPTLYSKLFDKYDLAGAISYARQELYNRKERRAYFDQEIELEDWLLPVIFQNQPLRLTTREFTKDEADQYYTEEANRYSPTQPTYGFVGRDLDILQVEKQLLTKRNLLLIRGMGGAGKTTLLQHLGWWWQTTGFIKQVFYFGYDERAWTQQQIVTAIARQLYGEIEYLKDFQPLNPKAQQARLVQRLRAERHLLILDNLESITGSHMAIQHTLPAEEQAALHTFLKALAGGRTLVLLGSRSSEEWLAKEIFDDALYDLGGLDSEAASTLADRILEKYGKTAYREQEDMRHLIKLLDGFPLALEVVLANLQRQTPTEVLTALQSGDVSLNTGDSEERTKNILRCIDYSHSNLSPDAQSLLVCLAPFTSVLNARLLDAYTDHLKQQSALSALPFERWQEVIQEAKNWGLLSADPNKPDYLHIQPTLPYFLRVHLNTPEQEAMRTAIETVFRELYTLIGKAICDLLESKKSEERALGQISANLEYENLVTALKQALATQNSILYLHSALSSYLDMTQDQRRGLELGQTVLKSLEAYPGEKLKGRSGAELIGVIDNIAERQLLLKQYDLAETSFQKALSLWLENTYYGEDTIRQKMSASIYHRLGIVAQEKRQFEQAEQYYQQALRIRIDFNDRYGQADTYHQLGRIAGEQRQYKQAERYYQQALQIYIDFNDRYEQAGTYHQLGIVAHEQQQFEQAKLYYQQALQIYIEFNERYTQARTYYQLGKVALDQRQFEQAEQYYQQVLQICIEFNDRYGQARPYHCLGIVAQERRQFEQAEQYCRQALQIYIDFNDRYEQAGPYYQLGRVAQEQQRWDKAQAFFLQALEIWVSYKDSYKRSLALWSLAQLWKATGGKDIPAAVAAILKCTHDEVEAGLRQVMEEE